MMESKGATLLTDAGTMLPEVLQDPQLTAAIFRSVTSGICIADARQRDMPVVYVNPAFETMTGYSMDEMLGRNCRVLQGTENDHTDEEARASIRKALSERRELLTVLKNFRKDGTPFWNELYLSPVRDGDGKVTHFVGIQSDVTARIEFERALRESEKLAAVGRLASSIAHEINNPLESVMNLVYLAQHADTPEETQKYLTIADGELQRVKLITSQSLRFYKQSTQARAIGCSELLEPVMNLYGSRLMQAGVTLDRRDRSELQVTCMESEIRQVLHNLVTNAIDAMRGTGGRLCLRTRDSVDPKSGRRGIVITVGDVGRGIAADALRNIYKAFFTTKGHGGTGLGLWISSEIVTRHGGSLRVRSSQRTGASGTVFQLFLPQERMAA